ncbi:MAG: hypothetical protein ACLR7U_03520 [Ruthenibacterium lactatiformans]
MPFTMGVLDTGTPRDGSVSHAARRRHAQRGYVRPHPRQYAGPIGATSVLILVACAMYLWMRRDITLGILSVFCSPARWWRFFTRV